MVVVVFPAVESSFTPPVTITGSLVQRMISLGLFLLHSLEFTTPSL